MMFGRRDSKNMFKEIARLNGVSVREVKEQMRLGIEQARNNPDPEAQAEFTISGTVLRPRRSSFIQ